MKEFNEKIVFYGELILSDETIKDLRCELTINHTNTDYNIAEISLPSTLRVRIHNLLNTQNKIIFQTENKNKSIYVESYGYILQDKFMWEASLTLYPYKVVIKDSYSDKEIKKVVFRAFVSPSELLFNETYLTYHEAKGLLSGWDYVSNPEKPEWIDNNFKYESEIGIIELIPGFIFKELKDDKFKQQYNIIRQLIVYCKLEGDTDMKNSEQIFFKKLGKLKKSLSLLFVKRINSWYMEVFAQDSDNSPVFDKRTFLKLSKKTQLKDNRLIVGIVHKKWRSTISGIMERLSKLTYEKVELFEKLLGRYLVAFTYDKIDTRIIYALSCLDLIKNSFERRIKERLSFTPNLIDVCETNRIEWLDLFPYLTKEEVFYKNIKRDMYLNEVRNDLIHYGIYPDNYNKSHDEILRARALSERFILRLLEIDYHKTGLGVLTRY